MLESDCNTSTCDLGLTLDCATPSLPRPCKGIAPVGMRWCKRIEGWPATSIVYTNCSFYYTPLKNYEDPDLEGSGWIPFEVGGIMEKIINGYNFKGYDCETAYLEKECIIDCGLWRVALQDNPTITPECSDLLPEEQRQWSPRMTMCQLMMYFNTDTYGQVVPSADGTSFTWINADGSTGATWLADTDTYGKVVDNGDGTFSWINADGTTGDTWVGDAHPAMVDTYGTLVATGDREWTWTPAGGGVAVVITDTGSDTDPAQLDEVQTSYDPSTGMLTTLLRDGTESSPVCLDAHANHPSVRFHTFPIPADNTSRNPAPLNESTTRSFGGWDGVGTNEYTVPKDGVYNGILRAQFNKGASDQNHDNKMKLQLYINDVANALSIVQSADDFGSMTEPETSNVKVKPDLVELKTGDKIKLVTEAVGDVTKTPDFVGGFLTLVHISGGCS